MADFNLDDIYVAVSEEALATADKICDYLSIPKDSPLFDTVVIECGRAFKPFLEHDHEMGLNARQKLLRGMIERTSVGAVRFEIISHDFIKQIASKDPDLFEVLQSLEKTKRLSTKDLAHNLYDLHCVDSQFLYGPWVDPNGSLLHLNKLQAAMQTLMYILQCSFVEQLSDIYKVHKTSAKATTDQQKKAVFETLHNKNPEEAQQFVAGIDNLQHTHPQLAHHLLQRFYFMAIEKDEYGTVFDPKHVLTSEQIQRLETMTLNLHKYWKQYPLAQVFAQQCAKEMADRALHIMEGVGRTDDLVVDVAVDGMDKDKIEERRAQTAQTLRTRMNP